jgi:predicted dehydrogenase
MTAVEAADLFTVAAERGVFLMEAMWMTFNPAFRRMREEIAAGRIGEPRSLRATFGIPWPRDGASRWDAARGGGALLDQGIYPVTLAHAVLGEPDTLHAGGVVQDDGLDLVEHFTLEYEDGRFAQCASSLTSFIDPSASVSGPQGWIVLPAPFWATTTVAVHADSWERMLQAPETVTYPQEGHGYVPMTREVVDAIAQGRTEHPWHTQADTVPVFRTLDRIRSRISASAAPITGQEYP